MNFINNLSKSVDSLLGNHYEKLGLLLLSSIFIVSGASGLLRNLNGFSKMLEGKGFPFPFYLAIFLLTFKIVAGIALNYKNRLAAQSLIVFMIVATVLFHNFLTDSSELMNFLRNTAVTGGLFLALR